MKNVLTAVLLSLSLSGFSQITIGTGFVTNFTPVASAGYNFSLHYEIPKTKDIIGYMSMEDKKKSYYAPFYGTKIGKQTKILAGVSFVNDYSGPCRKLSESYLIGFNYEFKPLKADKDLNLYTGFIYTNSYILLRGGMNLEVLNKKRKRK